MLWTDRDPCEGLILATISLADISSASASADDPAHTSPSTPRFGGVDPLGLRQINFDLMDEVFPGLNNVARHIRPFVLVTWAWRRAGQLAKASGEAQISADALRNFVDRMEVLFVASQIIRDPAVELPGSDFLRPWLAEPSIRFEGTWWKEQRKRRRDSTSLSAAINYGPGLRSFGWVIPHDDAPGIMLPTKQVQSALDSFEADLAPFLRNRAFSTLDDVTVKRKELERLAKAWPLERVTKQERKVMSNLLLGPPAPVGRQQGFRLMLEAVEDIGDSATEAVRAAMSGSPSAFKPSPELVGVRDAWRRVQVRQLFRLSLEALHYWLMIELLEGPRSMDSLVRAFLAGVPPIRRGTTAGSWLSGFRRSRTGPTEVIDRIQAALSNPEDGDLVAVIAEGIAFAVGEPSVETDKLQPTERLPLARAKQETIARSEATVGELVRHIVEAWVLAQHAYWSVGRGLADARAGGKVLLRLKVILDDGGWTLTPGATLGNPPQPTRDRLATALSLSRECDLID